MSVKNYNVTMNDFSCVKVSTQTFIIHSNLDDIQLMSVYDTLKMDVAYEDLDDDEEFVEFPRIITLSYKGVDKGKPKKRKNKVVVSKKGKNFLNCISFTVQIEPKKAVNVKLFNNGVFQLTGCKCYEHAKKTFLKVWSAMQNTPCVFEFKKEGFFSNAYMEAYVVSAMRNVDFRLGFEIDRERLGNYIIHNTQYNIVPIIQGFMGVQMSIPIESVADMSVHKISFPPDIRDDEVFLEETLRYDQFWKIKPKEEEKAMKGKAVTVAVFQTGKVLISGIDEIYQKPVFQWFIKEMDAIQDLVMIKKEEPKTFVDFLPKKRKSKFQSNTIFQKV